MTTSHALSPEDAMAFFDGELEPSRAAEASAHIQTCAACQQLGRHFDSIAGELDAWAIEKAPSTFVAPIAPVRPGLGPLAKIALVAAAAIVLILVAGRRAWWPQSEQQSVGVDATGVRRTSNQGASPAVPSGTAGGQGALPVTHPQSGGQRSTAELDQFTAAWLQRPREDLGFQIAGARVVIVMFIDWLCPSCYTHNNAYADVIARYQREYGGAVQYVAKDWPWNKECNPKVRTIPGHESSCVAALAVRIARDRGQEQAMVAWLFENYARLNGMTPEEVTDAIKRESQRITGVVDFDAAAAPLRPDLDRDIADGARLGIRSTPTFFINGVRIPNDQQLPAPYFDAAIAIELKRAQR